MRPQSWAKIRFIDQYVDATLILSNALNAKEL